MFKIAFSTSWIRFHIQSQWKSNRSLWYFFIFCWRLHSVSSIPSSKIVSIRTFSWIKCTEKVRAIDFYPPSPIHGYKYGRQQVRRMGNSFLYVQLIITLHRTITARSLDDHHYIYVQTARYVDYSYFCSLTRSLAFASKIRWLTF